MKKKLENKERGNLIPPNKVHKDKKKYSRKNKKKIEAK